MKKKSGLTNSDKIMVTVALWTALVSLFITALTLPVLPDQVAIMYKSVYDDKDVYSKFNNLLIVLASIIPIAIVILAATLKKHNKMQRNFASMLIFCMMLSLCLTGVTAFGINKQLTANPLQKSVSPYSIVAVVLSATFAFSCAAYPMLVHSAAYASRSEKRPPAATAFMAAVDRYWNFGAYGFTLIAIISAFVPFGWTLAFPLIGLVMYNVAMVIVTRRKKTAPADTQQEN